MLWYDELVRVRDVALWVRERKSEGGDKGERRCVSSPRRAGPLRARMQVRRLYKGPVELTRATLRADT